MKKFIIAGALLLALALAPAPAHAQTTAELQALIASLQQQLSALLVQLAALQNDTNQPPVVVASSTGSLSVNIWKNSTLTLQYDESQAEALRARFVYSITANNEDLYFPHQDVARVNLVETTSNKPTPGPRRVDTSSDAPVVNCSINDVVKPQCYMIKKGETKNFQTDYYYSPREMFAGSYYAWMSFILLVKDGGFTTYEVKASNQSTAPITIVGEKSPYITSFTSPVKAGDFVKMKGVRLGGRPMLMGSAYPVLDSEVLYNGTEAGFRVDPRTPAGIYNLQITTQNYGNSNIVKLEVQGGTDDPIDPPVPAPATITVTSPNGGENWAVGSKQYIRWSTTGTTGTERVRIRLIDPAGDERKLIASDLPNTGVAAWVVGQYDTGTVGVGRYNIKVCIKGASGADAVCDRGDARFTITDVTAATRVQMAAVLQSVQNIINSLFGIGS